MDGDPLLASLTVTGISSPEHKILGIAYVSFPTRGLGAIILMIPAARATRALGARGDVTHADSQIAFPLVGGGNRAATVDLRYVNGLSVTPRSSLGSAVSGAVARTR